MSIIYKIIDIRRYSYESTIIQFKVKREGQWFWWHSEVVCILSLNPTQHDVHKAIQNKLDTLYGVALPDLATAMVGKKFVYEIDNKC